MAILSTALPSFTFALSVSMAISAVLAPFLGAVADSTASKKRFLMIFCYMAIFFTGLLYFVHPGTYWRGALFFIMANIGFAGAMFITMLFSPKYPPRRTWVGFPALDGLSDTSGEGLSWPSTSSC